MAQPYVQERVRNCASCAYFCDTPARIEEQIPGLTCMGSAYASVRSTDGICTLHGRYLAGTSSCASHTRADTDSAIC
jgi:hypothetical protein